MYIIITTAMIAGGIVLIRLGRYNVGEQLAWQGPRTKMGSLRRILSNCTQAERAFRVPATQKPSSSGVPEVGTAGKAQRGFVVVDAVHLHLRL